MIEQTYIYDLVEALARGSRLCRCPAFNNAVPMKISLTEALSNSGSLLFGKRPPSSAHTMLRGRVNQNSSPTAAHIKELIALVKLQSRAHVLERVLLCILQRLPGIVKAGAKVSQ